MIGLSEFSEYPSVEGGLDRRLVFPEVRWLTKAKFIQCSESKNFTLHPNLNNTDLKNVEKDDVFSSYVYIGKSIPKTPPQQQQRQNLSSNGQFLNSYRFLELIGSVYKTSTKWVLRVTHDGHVHEIDEDFLVLSIKDANSFYWSSNRPADKPASPHSFEFNNTDLAKFAMRVSVDKFDAKYNYLGRTLLSDDSVKRPKFYAGGWFYFDDENIQQKRQTFGRINSSYKLLFSPLKNIEVGCDYFETLCLKASPASLKVLCRTAIRKYTNFSQFNLKNINKLERKLIPDSLINYLKYPNFLKIGECLLNDEKLVSESGEYELAFDKQTGHLVCRSLTANQEEKKIVIARNVDLIWLHKFGTIFFNQVNSIAHTAHSIYDKLSAYKFCMEWDSATHQVMTLV